MPRLFVAIDLPERLHDDITATYAAIPGVRWVEEKQLHVTLQFIGEVDPPRLEQIVNALRTVSLEPFALILKGVGYFPPRKDPRVLWIGIAPSDELMRLQSRIARTLSGIGIVPEDRKFHPHITVARLNNSPRDKVASYVTANSLFSTEPFDVSEFYLYESILRKEGALHIKDATFGLRE